MYTNYCGDIVTCDSDTGHPESPIDYAMPVPCCLPCPCLQPCSTNKQPCCPESGSHNDNHSYFKASGEISTSNHIDQFSVTQSKEHTTTDVYPHRSVINQQEGSQSEFDYDNHTDVIQSVTDAAKRGVTNTGTTVHLLPHTYCIRPQLFNHPNFFIDSDAYMMVKFCFRGKEMVDKCYGEHVNTGMSDMTPITSRLSGLTYVNRFCFMCNEGDVINETLADVWDVMSVYYKTEYHHRSVFHPDEMTDLKIGFSAGFSNIHFVPRMRNLVQPCEAYDVNSCNQTGLWDAYDETVEKICHEGHSVPILHRISYGYDRLRFKNIACVYCNAGDNFNSNTTLSCGYRPRKKAVYSYSQTLNLRVLDTDKENDEVREKQLISYTQRAILPLPNTDICPSGYIALLVRTLLST